MKRSFAVAAVLLLAPFAAASGQEAREAASTTDAMPVTTSSEEALNHYQLGLHALDMGRPDDARGHLETAVAADPDFAIAYLYLANASNSLDAFRTNLDRASEKASLVSEGERLLIEIERAQFEDDLGAARQAADRLVEIQPSSPRAWMALASVQGDLGDESAARASLEKAIEVAPDFLPPHVMLGNSYMFLEPRDLAAAERHMAHAVELEPEEAGAHDLLGDAYRAQGELEKAAEEYTRTAELDPESGDGLQQRGHVHTFLGNYDQARADYDAAIELEQGENTAAQFRVYRALVSVHEGNPQAAVDELNALVDEIDAMGIPEPTGLKIFALNTVILIAEHHQLFDAARAAIERRNPLLEEQARRLGTEAAQRNARAEIVITDGFMAARQGDFETATAKAAEFMTIMQPGTDPERNEPAHALLGYVSLKQQNYDAAIGHFEQADADDIYTTYYRAKSLEKAGRNDEARELFTKIANYNFNEPGLALVRKAVIERVQ